ncbi:MAG TPA: hypothetical protein VIC25_03975 [Caulobacteraceae bacterium]|jgi:hypothetical protein
MNAAAPMAAVSRRICLLILALAAGPAAWIGQLVIGYGISSYACFPATAPAQISPPPGWSGEVAGLLALNLACLILSLLGAALAFRLWRRPGAGPAAGRTRFLAGCGLFSGLGFALAILFDTVPILGVPACWAIPT